MCSGEDIPRVKIVHVAIKGQHEAEGERTRDIKVCLDCRGSTRKTVIYEEIF
jgi:hypothetical protein